LIDLPADDSRSFVPVSRGNRRGALMMSEAYDISVLSDLHDTPELATLLEKEVTGESDIKVTQRIQESETRDPTVVVALITGGASVLVSLITAVATIWAARLKDGGKEKEKSASDEIRVFSRSGELLLVIPAATPRDQISDRVLPLATPVGRIALVRPIR
jgi:hypothetical protein